MTPALEIAGLKIAVGSKPILRGVDLTVAPGETVGLAGRSGAGKSLTALAAMGLLPAHFNVGGAIRVGGLAMTGVSEGARCGLRGRVIAMVFQEPMTALNPLQRIGAQIAEGFGPAVARKEARDRANALLERVGLAPAADYIDRYPHELSGGQRQRVVIAIAIAGDPQAIIADEPTTALDAVSQRNILALLKSLAAERGIALLIITHNLAALAQVAERIAVLEDGVIAQSGRTRDLLVERSASSPPADNRAPDHAAGPPALDVDGLSCVYAERRAFFGRSAEVRAVDHVSFSIARGECVGLVGRSGCGKSTLARAALGLEPVAAGKIEIEGRSFSGGDPAADCALRRKIQIVFQDPFSSFNPRWRAGAYVAEPLHLCEDKPTPAARRERIDNVLRAVDLAPADAEKFPHEFSGGQRQRLAIARALIVEPSIVVLDEATSALDDASRDGVLELLAKIRRERGVALLIITHDANVVRRTAQRLLVMDNGRIVEEGPAASVLADPQSEAARALVEAAPPVAYALRPAPAASA